MKKQILSAILTVSMVFSMYVPTLAIDETKILQQSPQKTSEQNKNQTGIAQSDVFSPKLNNVIANKNIANANEKVEFEVDLSNSQINVNSVHILLEGIKTNKTLNVYCCYDESLNKNIGILDIPQYIIPDDFVINSIFINTDNNDSIKYIRKKYEWEIEETLPQSILDFKLQILNDNPDTLAPQLKNLISFTNEINLKNQKKLKFEMEVTDDKSGVACQKIALTNENGNEIYGFLYNNSNEIKPIYIDLYETTHLGNYKVKLIELTDEAGNISKYEGEALPDYVKNISVKISNDDIKIDIEPPVLNDVTVDNIEINSGENIVFHIDATDNMVGISEMDFTIKGENSNNIYSQRIEVIEEKSPYICEITIPLYAPSDTYYISEISIADKKYNFIKYVREQKDIWGEKSLLLPDEIKKIKINVKNQHQADIEGPYLKNVTVDKTNASGNDCIKFTIDAIDDLSQIKKAQISLTCNNDGSNFSVDLEKNNDNLIGYFDFNENMISGTYFIDKISLSDNIGNSTHYGIYFGNNILPKSVRDIKINFKGTDIEIPTEEMEDKNLSKICGKLYDCKSKLPLENIYVKLIDKKTDFKKWAKTNSDGEYSFINIPNGHYDLKNSYNKNLYPHDFIIENQNKDLGIEYISKNYYLTGVIEGDNLPKEIYVDIGKEITSNGNLIPYSRIRVDKYNNTFCFSYRLDFNFINNNYFRVTAPDHKAYLSPKYILNEKEENDIITLKLGEPIENNTAKVISASHNGMCKAIIDEKNKQIYFKEITDYKIVENIRFDFQGMKLEIFDEKGNAINANNGTYLKLNLPNTTYKAIVTAKDGTKVEYEIITSIQNTMVFNFTVDTIKFTISDRLKGKTILIAQYDENNKMVNYTTEIISKTEYTINQSANATLAKVFILDNFQMM